jgi:hypothetical protein
MAHTAAPFTTIGAAFLILDTHQGGGDEICLTYASRNASAQCFGLAIISTGLQPRRSSMSLGTILVIILIIFLLGGFSGRFGGYGYGFGHGGVGVLGTILIIVLVLMLLGRL